MIFKYFCPILFKLQGLLDIGKKHSLSKLEGPIQFFALSARVSIFTFFVKNGSRAEKLIFFKFYLFVFKLYSIEAIIKTALLFKG